MPSSSGDNSKKLNKKIQNGSHSEKSMRMSEKAKCYTGATDGVRHEKNTQQGPIKTHPGENEPFQ